MNSSQSTKDKPLFTPGPLTTSQTVKQSMLRDLGSRDAEFIRLVKETRNELLAVAGVSQESGFECILMQGSGTFGIEAVLTCAVPKDGKWLIVINGAYGKRMQKIVEVHGIDYVTLDYDENVPVSAEDVDRVLANDDNIDAVAFVHCETTTGIMNPIESIADVVKKHARICFVDSMSAFGGVRFDIKNCGIDFIVSSANKCIEGVPGFSFCIANRASLQRTEGWSRTLSFDLFAQWQGLEQNGQFRFTPPTHTILAFRQAIEELKLEGGVAGRENRYRANCRLLIAGMRKLGFEEYLPEHLQGHIITSFLYPSHKNFEFETFYNKLNDRGFVIYPGKVSNANCFRIGNIGQIFESDVESLLQNIEQVIEEMNVEMSAIATQ